MNTANSYRRYPELVKHEVARTQNIHLFPDLKIPRTTAQYWVQKEKHVRRALVPDSVVEVDSLYKKKSEYLLKELEKEKALRQLLECVRKIFPYDFQAKHLKSKLGRTQIVAAIRDCIKFHKLSQCLQAIGLSKSAYPLGFGNSLL